MRTAKSLDRVGRKRAEQITTDLRPSREGITIKEFLLSDGGEDEDDERSWEDLDQRQHSSGSSTYQREDHKTYKVLGVSSSEDIITVKEASDRSLSLDLETSKGREVMGIDSPPVSAASSLKTVQTSVEESKSPPAQEKPGGRHKSPTLTRVIKSFNNFQK